MPTLREAGFPDVVATNWFGFSAAADIPPEIARRWETEIATALQSAQVKEAFAKIGVRPGTLGAAGYTDLIRSELARWKEVIRRPRLKHRGRRRGIIAPAMALIAGITPASRVRRRW